MLISDRLKLLNALQWQYTYVGEHAGLQYVRTKYSICARHIVPTLHANQAMAACSSSMAEAGDSNWDFMQYMQESICSALHMQYMHYMQNSICITYMQ